MVQLTRFDCVIGSATQMRHALSLAAHHVQGRAAFQKKLIDQPLMRAVIADLALDAEAAVALTFRLGMALDRAKDDPNEAALARIGLPLAKYLVTKRCPTVVAEALECFGGAGYVEEGPMPRLFRQSPLNGIWEGSGNVIALDVMRALAREPAAPAALVAEIAAADAGDGKFKTLSENVEAVLARPPEEARARHNVEWLALAFAAAVLSRFAPAAVADGFIARRLESASLTFGAHGASIDEDALIARAALAT
jgi:putative acyl-CoA dehydrogenase